MRVHVSRVGRLLLLVTLAALFGACGKSGQIATPGSTSPVTRGASSPSSFDPPPLTPRFGAEIASTSRFVLMFGGRTRENGSVRTNDDGAVLDLWTGAWTTMARLPFDGDVADPAIVAAETSFILVGRRGSALVAAQYNPEDNAWDRLPSPDFGKLSTAEPTAAVGWTDSKAVFSIFVDGGTRVAFSPQDQRWSEIPDVARIIEPYCLTRSDVVAMGGPETSSQLAPTGTDVSEEGFNTHTFRAGRWSTIEPEPREVEGQATSSILCGGYAVTYLPWRDGGIAAPTWWFNSSNQTWEEAPPLAIEAGVIVNVGQLANGTRVVSFPKDGDLLVFTNAPGASTWRESRLTGRSKAGVVPVGDELLVFPPDPIRDGLVFAQIS